MSIRVLDSFKAIVDDAFRDTPFNKRQVKAGAVLSEAFIHLSRTEFQELEKYVFKKLK